VRLATMSVVLYFSTLAIAQKAATGARPEATLPVSKATIEVGGVVLRLGMTKAQVAEKLVGNEISKMHEDEWMLGSLEKKNIGPTLQFTKGVLSYADREWVNSDNDIGEALFGAISSLNEEGFSACDVTASTKNSPSLAAERVFVTCGAKTVAVVRRSFGGHAYTSVYEQLGTMRDVTE
jgi:hypothetical protein